MPETETRSLLEKCLPEKLAPPDTVGFSLVLLAIRSSDLDAVIDAVHRGLDIPSSQARQLIRRPPPVTLASGLGKKARIMERWAASIGARVAILP